MDRPQAERIVLSKGWLSGQPASFQAAFLERTELIRLDKGDYAFQAGDAPGGLYGVVAGSLGVCIATPHTGPDLAHILHPGWWCGEAPALAGQRRVLSVMAMEPSFVLHLPLGAAREFAQSNVEAAQSIALLGQIALRIFTAIVSDLMIRRADRRVGAVLLRVTGAIEDAVLQRAGDIRLTQGQLADMANASRDLVNRTLAHFESAGWVRLGYNRMAVTDPAALAAFAYDRDEGRPGHH